MPNPRRSGLTNPAPVLDAMRACREAMLAIQRAYPPRSGVYREAGVILSDLDDLAALLTGRRDTFRPPGHGTPKS